MDANPYPPSGERHRLMRSRRERMWTGVCGGMAEYFDIDPVLVRLFWVVGTVITAGLGLVAYFCLAVIMPPDDRGWDESWSSSGGASPAAGEPHDWERPRYGPYDYGRRRHTAGIILVALGILFLINQAGIFHWIQWHLFWPAILILIGVALILRRSDWRS